jgi:plasmid stability protein
MAHLQIRDVRHETHAALKARAAREGRTLSDLLRDELDRIAARPTEHELLARLAARPRTTPAEPVADTVRRLRDAG